MIKRYFLSLITCTCFYLLAASFTSKNGNYEVLKVTAPFPMQPIKVFIYPDKDFIITDFGAVNGGRVDNTKAITSAIEACNQSGGGRVVVPAGTWLTGPIHFKSNVNLYLEENAVLNFTDNPSDYLPAVMTSWEGLECYNYSPLLYAFECENVAITGKGTLQPKMDTWKVWFKRPQSHLEALKELYTKASTNIPVIERQMAIGENHLRPHLIHFNRCKNVLLVIRNCQILKGHTLLGIGSEISGGIRNIYMHDCTAPNSVMRLFFVKTNHRRGGFIENVYMKNVKAGTAQRVLEIDTEVLYQWKDLVPTYEERITRIDGIYMDKVTCESADAIYELKGNSKLPAKNVMIRDVKVGEVKEFVKKVNNVENVVEKNVTYDRKGK